MNKNGDSQDVTHQSLAMNFSIYYNGEEHLTTLTKELRYNLKSHPKMTTKNNLSWQ